MPNIPPKQPLAEVFGFPIHDISDEAKRYRAKNLCPFNNKVPNCTKDKAKDPLGVCSVLEGSDIAITCPVRFRQNWVIADDAADFFFPPEARWTTLVEVRLNDKNGKSAGNIDIVLVSYDGGGKVIDFGALEVQAVYISGNVRNPFEHYMTNPVKNRSMDWSDQENYPRPDYLSSSRKRLVPQLIFKGGIFNAWGKRTAVALNSGFFNTLPKLKEVRKSDADIAWLIYDVKSDPLKPGLSSQMMKLVKVQTVYTKFEPALNLIAKPRPGDIKDFIGFLQTKVDEKLENPPSNETLEDSLFRRK